MGENLYRLAAEDDRGDAMPAVRGHASGFWFLFHRRSVLTLFVGCSW
jgi:hypothetical protein